MYCGKCGRKLPDNTSQCSWCNQHTKTSIQNDNNGSAPKYQKFKIPALVAVLLCIICFGGFIYSRFGGNNESVTTDNNHLIPIISRETECAKAFNATRRAIHEKSWSSFISYVDVEKVLSNDAKDEMKKISQKSGKNNSEADRFANEFIQTFLPMVMAQWKQAIYDYVTNGYTSDPNMENNLHIRLLKLEPKEVKGEKKEGNYIFLPVVYTNPQNGKDIILEFGFAEDNKVWKMVMIRHFHDFANKMGWGSDSNFSPQDSTTYSQPNRTDNRNERDTLRTQQPVQQRSLQQRLPKDSGTIEQRNALISAESYARNQHMSKQSVYEQLLFEKFNQADALWAINHLTGIDWNRNALNSAISYQRDMHMSIGSIKDQLLFEGFTNEQADYAIKHLPK